MRKQWLDLKITLLGDRQRDFLFLFLPAKAITKIYAYMPRYFFPNSSAAHFAVWKKVILPVLAHCAFLLILLQLPGYKSDAPTSIEPPAITTPLTEPSLVNTVNLEELGVERIRKLQTQEMI